MLKEPKLIRNKNERALDCRSFELVFVVAIAIALLNCTGCVRVSTEPADSAVTWGKRGIGKARFQKPRAIAMIPDVAAKSKDTPSNVTTDQLFIIDMTARIQSFDLDGGWLHKWRTPEFKTGKPCGLSVSNDGLLMVADTHYHRVLFYTTDGELVESRTLGGTLGRGPGEFGFVTDVAQDSEDNYYVAEYGDFDRIQKFSADGEFVFEWGGHGREPSQFLRPQGLLIDEKDQLWVADASNHRIQIFDATGDEPKLVAIWGEHGTGIGQIRYPYDLAFDGDGNVFVLSLIHI